MMTEFFYSEGVWCFSCVCVCVCMRVVVFLVFCFLFFCFFVVLVVFVSSEGFFWWLHFFFLQHVRVFGPCCLLWQVTGWWAAVMTSSSECGTYSLVSAYVPWGDTRTPSLPSNSRWAHRNQQYLDPWYSFLTCDAISDTMKDTMKCILLWLLCYYFCCCFAFLCLISLAVWVSHCFCFCLCLLLCVCVCVCVCVSDMVLQCVTFPVYVFW